jgi:hypothetical protein
MTTRSISLSRCRVRQQATLLLAASVIALLSACAGGAGLGPTTLGSTDPISDNRPN